MRSLARRVLAIGVAVCVFGVTAAAQRSADIVAGVGTHHDAEASVGGKARSGEEMDGPGKGHAVGMANGALLGAGIGAAIGLVAAPIVNAQNSDHTEDGTTYIILPAFGALLGLIVGGIVGWTRVP